MASLDTVRQFTPALIILITVLTAYALFRLYKLCRSQTRLENVQWLAKMYLKAGFEAQRGIEHRIRNWETANNIPVPVESVTDGLKDLADAALIDISAALQIAAQSLLPAFLRREFRDAKKRADTSIELFVVALLAAGINLQQRKRRMLQEPPPRPSRWTVLWDKAWGRIDSLLRGNRLPLLPLGAQAPPQPQGPQPTAQQPQAAH